ncbi:MAG: hypothetical protein Q4D90_06770 [bacterium]|nr:hypothetical protein [bacterium]
MRELIILCRLELEHMLYTLFANGKGKRRRNISVGAGLLLMAVLSLALSFSYSFLFGMSLQQADILEFYFPLILLLAVLVSLFFSFTAAKGIVFGGRDLDFLLSMPVSAFSVMLSKMTALYLENLVFVGFWLLPSAVVGFLYGAASGVSFWLRLIPTILFLPCLPTFLAALAGYLAALVQARSKRRSLFNTLLYVVFFLLLMLAYMQINRLGELMLAHRELVTQLFYSWLAPVGFLGYGLGSSWGYFWLGLLLCLLPFLLLTWHCSRQYQQILSSLRAQTVHTDFRLTKLKSDSPFWALFKKETERLFFTPMYLVNTSIGSIVLIALSVYLVAQKSSWMPLLSLLGSKNASALFLAGIAFLLATIYPSSVAISLEGKNLWLIKEAPLSPPMIFGAKAALNLILAWPVVLVVLLLFYFTGTLPGVSLFWMLPVCMGLTAFLAAGGICLNLRFPKLDWENETFAVKNSASAMFAYFGGMATVLFAAVVWFFLLPLFPFWVLCFGTTAVFVLLTLCLWQLLCHWGTEQFIRL